MVSWHRRAVGIEHRDQQVGEIGAGAVIIGSKFNGAVQFLKCATGVAQLEKGLAELVVGLGKAGVNLNGVGILNYRFAVLALGEIALAALKILLLAHIGIARTAGEESENRAGNNETKNHRATHNFRFLQLLVGERTGPHHTDLDDTAR